MEGSIFAGVVINFTNDKICNEIYEKVCHLCQGYIVGITLEKKNRITVSLNGDPHYIKEKLSEVEKIMTKSDGCKIQLIKND